jgi:hypothetical protein
VFTADNGQVPEFPSRTDARLSTVVFTPEKVERAMKKMKGNMGCGPDGHPSGFIKKLAPHLSVPFCMLFNMCMLEGVLPEVWLEAIVNPLYKKGKKSDVANYRPISLTSVIAKIMERVIKDEMMAFLESDGLLSDSQHGFRGKRSTTTQLLQCLNQWCKAIDDDNYVVDAAYLDFKKAFDSVVHSKLLVKLKAYGIDGELYRFCVAFLSGRTQRVRVGKILSSARNVTSGVPQGSVLGPLFFILYINDLPDTVVESSIAIYADDAKVFHFTRRGEYPHGLQHDLGNGNHWSDIWQLFLSPPKCIALRFASRAQEAVELQLGGIVLGREKETRDLGVMMCSDLRFRTHIFSIVGKAYQRLNLIFRCFQTRNRDFLVRMFITYVRPLVESGNVVWSPSQAYLIKKLEGVQRVFTKRVPGFDDRVCYAVRMSALNLESLEERRLKFDLCEVYKMEMGLSGLNFDEFFDRSIDARTRGHSKKLRVPLNSGRISDSFFSHRVVDNWNALSDFCVTRPTLTSFKNALSLENIARHCNGVFVR